MTDDWYGMKWIRHELRLAIYDRDGYACVYCGTSRHLTLDHLRPRNNGGNHKPRNLVTACRSCNASRGDNPWWEFVDDNEVITRIKRNRRRSVKMRRMRAKRVLRQLSWDDVIKLIRKGEQS